MSISPVFIALAATIIADIASAESVEVKHPVHWFDSAKPYHNCSVPVLLSLQPEHGEPSGPVLRGSFHDSTGRKLGVIIPRAKGNDGETAFERFSEIDLTTIENGFGPATLGSIVGFSECANAPNVTISASMLNGTALNPETTTVSLDAVSVKDSNKLGSFSYEMEASPGLISCAAGALKISLSQENRGSKVVVKVVGDSCSGDDVVKTDATRELTEEEARAGKAPWLAEEWSDLGGKGPKWSFIEALDPVFSMICDCGSTAESLEMTWSDPGLQDTEVKVVTRCGCGSMTKGPIAVPIEDAGPFMKAMRDYAHEFYPETSAGGVRTASLGLTIVVFLVAFVSLI